MDFGYAFISKAGLPKPKTALIETSGLLSVWFESTAL